MSVIRLALRQLFLLALVLSAALTFAQIDVVRFTAKVDPAQAAPNQVINIRVDATIERGWHLYSTEEVADGPVPTSFTLPEGGPLVIAGAVSRQVPERKFDPNFEKEVAMYSGTAWFEVPVRVSQTASGNVESTITVRFMACDDRSCLPPRNVELPIQVLVSGTALADDDPLALGPAASEAGTPNVAATTTSPQVGPGAAVSDTAQAIGEAKTAGILPFILLSITFGFLSLLTPCVFPMIPITVSFFAKRREKEGIGSATGQAIAYSLGIIGTFTALGVMVSAIFGASGLQKFSTNPWLNLSLALLFILLALNLFGVFEIRMPSGIANVANSSAAGKNKYVAPVLMAFAFTITSFTCTLPFAGTLLVSASQGEFFYPIVGMLAFSTAFASPFFLLALFPQAISKMPKSGSWMVVVKAFMGFLELAAAVKFMSNADLVWQTGFLTREVFLALWAGIMAFAGMYMLGWLRLPKIEDAEIGWFRRGVGVASVALAGWFLVAINGRPLGELDAFLPPVPYPGQEPRGGTLVAHGNWVMSYQEGLELARNEGKPLFIDFTGVTCTNCRWMEKNMFPRPKVVQRFDRFILVKLYTDRGTPEDNANQELQKNLTGSVTLPIYVVMEPDEKPARILEGSTRNEAEFVRFLDEGLAKTTGQKVALK